MALDPSERLMPPFMQLPDGIAAHHENAQEIYMIVTHCVLRHGY